MSLNIQQIITDAKRLAGRLKDCDSVADILLNETHTINRKIEAMKQYQDEVEELNNVAQEKPHSQLIANIQKENRHLREIQQENRELKAALEEHQTALEHIMTKYRQHTTQQIYKSRINFQKLQDNKYNEIIREQMEKIQEMAAVMEKAASTEEQSSLDYASLLSKLIAENRGLREMLNISRQYGSLGNLRATTTEDKTVQTDHYPA